ncbi:MAG: efflux transporter outer membrane subunit [Candidatus Amulumruptor caecigallinarius]|nr:efflux transporter outer membrane subunit [Candidatus Amulumruptor caecigallinarius]MCM1397794.1 efflux transporter outer membrane subunit [Candidatus Amulumruptor caecigallinarius]MCM1454842.1 efflux transporter outer membrane subunit [bacterium]
MKPRHTLVATLRRYSVAVIAATAMCCCHPTAGLRQPDTAILPTSFIPEDTTRVDTAGILPGTKADSLRRAYSALRIDSAGIASLRWWQIFNDPTLQTLLERAVAHNRDLKAAAARVEEVRELFGIAKADYYPHVSFTAEGQRETKWEHPSKSKSGGAPVAERQAGNYSPDPQITLKLNVGWEINLWGKLTWARRQVAENYTATIDDERAMRMDVISRVASTYFRLVALENEYSIVRYALDNRRESMEKARLRFEGGLTSETVYQQARTDYLSAATLIPGIERQRKMLRNALALLTGSFSGIDTIAPTLNLADVLPPTLPTGVPSHLLRQRPDLRAAEARMRAAADGVGVAYTDRFPSLYLSFSAGWWNSSFSRFFKSPYYYPIGGITGNVFDFGRKQREYRAAIARYDQACHAYEQSLLGAFAEVRDAVASYESYHLTAETNRELTRSAAEYVRLAELQYHGGTLSFLDVLDARRALLNSSLDMSNALRDEYLALVNLYKALGGGWEMPGE